MIENVSACTFSGFVKFILESHYGSEIGQLSKYMQHFAKVFLESDYGSEIGQLSKNMQYLISLQTWINNTINFFGDLEKIKSIFPLIVLFD